MQSSPTIETYWYSLKRPKITKLDRDLELDVVIIGGGIAGLMCAQKLKWENKNLKIAVIEASFCGSGASGKSSGFITPDSELELADLVREYGAEEGKRLWEFSKSGVESIARTIERRNLDCDYSIQDSVFVATSERGYAKVRNEYIAERDLGYDAWLYDAEKMERVVGGQGYFGGVRTKGSFGMTSYLFCQELKESLFRDSVPIYEDTPITEIMSPYVKTAEHIIQAEKIIVCTDRYLPRFGLAEKEVYHAQTFLMLSKPLSQDVVNNIFPGGPVMVWDTDLIYHYYRIVEGNRLLIGASNLRYTYARKERGVPAHIIRSTQTYVREKFPNVTITFEYAWPGLIGVSKDFLPIVGRDPSARNVYFVGAAAGLPWAAALGEYIAEKILSGRDDFDAAFSPDRKFPVGRTGTSLISKPLAFGLSHGIKKYFH